MQSLKANITRKFPSLKIENFGLGRAAPTGNILNILSVAVEDVTCTLLSFLQKLLCCFL